jgi:hypothetical protein
MGGQRVEGRGWKAESKGQRARERREDSREKRTEGGGQRAEGKGRADWGKIGMNLLMMIERCIMSDLIKKIGKKFRDRKRKLKVYFLINSTQTHYHQSLSPRYPRTRISFPRQLSTRATQPEDLTLFTASYVTRNHFDCS